MPLPAALVLLNGPPRAGKDTAAADLVGRAPGLVARLGFSAHLKAATHAAYGLLDAEGRPLPVDAFEAVKDRPRVEFLGLSPRQAYIAHSESYMKPQHGADVFGLLFLRRLAQSTAQVVVAADSGFAAEAVPALEALGRDRVLLLRVGAAGRGCSFAGDSRAYIDLPGVRAVELVNDAAGDPAPFLRAVRRAVLAFLEDLPGAEQAFGALLGDAAASYAWGVAS